MPSQLYETVQQMCYCEFSFGTTFDYYDPEAISQWCDTLCHQFVVNMGKYLLKKGKVCKNSKCLKAQVVFAAYFPFEANIILTTS